MNDITGTVLTTAGVFGLIAAVTVLEKALSLSKETTRKLVHIGAGHALFLMYAMIENKWYAAGVMVLFTILNYISLRSNMFAAMETKERQSFGTVYYPLAMVILIVIFYDVDKIAIAVGMMALAWGDGMAAAVGSKYGKNKYNIYGQHRSFEGSAAALVFSLLAIVVVFLVYGHMTLFGAILRALPLATATAVIEGVSYGDLDNLFIPFSIAALSHFF
jgi:phytol kinase